MAEEHRIGPWTFVYGGGRLADVFHDESSQALHSIQACEYDWTTGTPNFDRAAFEARCEAFVRDHAQEYIINELPYAREEPC